MGVNVNPDYVLDDSSTDSGGATYYFKFAVNGGGEPGQFVDNELGRTTGIETIYVSNYDQATVPENLTDGNSVCWDLVMNDISRSYSATITVSSADYHFIYYKIPAKEVTASDDYRLIGPIDVGSDNVALSTESNPVTMLFTKYYEAAKYEITASGTLEYMSRELYGTLYCGSTTIESVCTYGYETFVAKKISDFNFDIAFNTSTSSLDKSALFNSAHLKAIIFSDDNDEQAIEQGLASTKTITFSSSTDYTDRSVTIPDTSYTYIFLEFNGTGTCSSGSGYYQITEISGNDIASGQSKLLINSLSVEAIEDVNTDEYKRYEGNCSTVECKVIPGNRSPKYSDTYNIKNTTTSYVTAYPIKFKTTNEVGNPYNFGTDWFSSTSDIYWMYISNVAGITDESEFNTSNSIAMETRGDDDFKYDYPHTVNVPDGTYKYVYFIIPSETSAAETVVSTPWELESYYIATSTSTNPVTIDFTSKTVSKNCKDIYDTMLVYYNLYKFDANIIYSKSSSTVKPITYHQFVESKSSNFNFNINLRLVDLAKTVTEAGVTKIAISKSSTSPTSVNSIIQKLDTTNKTYTLTIPDTTYKYIYIYTDSRGDIPSTSKYNLAYSIADTKIIASDDSTFVLAEISLAQTRGNNDTTKKLATTKNTYTIRNTIINACTGTVEYCTDIKSIFYNYVKDYYISVAFDDTLSRKEEYYRGFSVLYLAGIYISKISDATTREDLFSTPDSTSYTEAMDYSYSTGNLLVPTCEYKYLYFLTKTSESTTQLIKVHTLTEDGLYKAGGVSKTRYDIIIDGIDSADSVQRTDTSCKKGYYTELEMYDEYEQWRLNYFYQTCYKDSDFIIKLYRDPDLPEAAYEYLREDRHIQIGLTNINVAKGTGFEGHDTSGVIEWIDNDRLMNTDIGEYIELVAPTSDYRYVVMYYLDETYDRTPKIIKEFTNKQVVGDDSKLWLALYAEIEGDKLDKREDGSIVNAGHTSISTDWLCYEYTQKGKYKISINDDIKVHAISYNVPVYCEGNDVLDALMQAGIDKLYISYCNVTSMVDSTNSKVISAGRLLPNHTESITDLRYRYFYFKTNDSDELLKINCDGNEYKFSYYDIINGTAAFSIVDVNQSKTANSVNHVKVITENSTISSKVEFSVDEGGTVYKGTCSNTTTTSYNSEWSFDLSFESSQYSIKNIALLTKIVFTSANSPEDIKLPDGSGTGNSIAYMLTTSKSDGVTIAINLPLSTYTSIYYLYTDGKYEKAHEFSIAQIETEFAGITVSNPKFTNTDKEESSGKLYEQLQYEVTTKFRTQTIRNDKITTHIIKKYYYLINIDNSNPKLLHEAAVITCLNLVVPSPMETIRFRTADNTQEIQKSITLSPSTIWRVYDETDMQYYWAKIEVVIGDQTRSTMRSAPIWTGSTIDDLTKLRDAIKNNKLKISITDVIYKETKY